MLVVIMFDFAYIECSLKFMDFAVSSCDLLAASNKCGEDSSNSETISKIIFN